MSKFANSFETIYEALITRATTGCFSAGDVVTFDAKGIQKHDDYKKLTNALKSRLDDMMRTSENGESVIVVTDTTLGVLNGTKAPSPSTITIAYSQGGGRWVEPITIPGSLTEFMTAVEPGVNLVDKIPATSKITYSVETQAEEVDLKELEKNRTKGHASSTLHGESYERNENSSGDITFQVGKKYQADWGGKHIFEVIKRTETQVVLKPLTFDPDSLEGMIHNKPIRRKIQKSYYPHFRAYCEHTRISPYAGQIYADRPYNDYKGHASSTLHGESYSPYLNDTEIDIGVYFDITSAFNEWMNDSKYPHPKMKREMIFNEIMNKIKSYNNNYIKKFGENIIITDDDGKTYLYWENFSTTAAEAKCYAEDGIPDEALYEEIYDSIPETGFESFDSYIYDKLNDFLEIIGADDYGDYVSARERRRDDYMSTVSSAWNNRFR